MQALKENIEMRAAGKVPGFERLGECLKREEMRVDMGIGSIMMGKNQDFIKRGAMVGNRKFQNGQGFKMPYVTGGLGRRGMKSQAEQVNQKLQDLEVGERDGLFNMRKVQKLKQKLGFKNVASAGFGNEQDQILEMHEIGYEEGPLTGGRDRERVVQYLQDLESSKQKRRTVPKKRKAQTQFIWEEDEENVMTNSGPSRNQNPRKSKRENPSGMRKRHLENRDSHETQNGGVRNQGHRNLNNQASIGNESGEIFEKIEERTKKSKRSGGDRREESKVSNFTYKKKSEYSLNSNSPEVLENHSGGLDTFENNRFYKNKTQNFGLNNHFGRRQEQGNLKRNFSQNASDHSSGGTSGSARSESGKSSQNMEQTPNHKRESGRSAGKSQGLKGIGQVMSIFKRSKQMVKSFKKKRKLAILEKTGEEEEKQKTESSGRSERRKGLLVTPPLVTSGKTSDQELEEMVLKEGGLVETPVGGGIGSFERGVKTGREEGKDPMMTPSSKGDREKQSKVSRSKQSEREGDETYESVKSRHTRMTPKTPNADNLNSKRRTKESSNKRSQNKRSGQVKKSEKKSSGWGDDEEDDFGDLDSCFASSLDFANSNNQSTKLEKSSSKKIKNEDQGLAFKIMNEGETKKDGGKRQSKRSKPSSRNMTEEGGENSGFDDLDMDDLVDEFDDDFGNLETENKEDSDDFFDDLNDL